MAAPNEKTICGLDGHGENAKGEKQGLGESFGGPQPQAVPKNTAASNGGPGGSRKGDGEGSHASGNLSGTQPEEPGTLTQAQKKRQRRKMKVGLPTTDNSSVETPKDGGQKRSIAMLTPSSGTSILTKKPREDDSPRTFAGVAKSHKISVVCDGFPSVTLQKEDVDIILKHILEKIDKIPEDNVLPKISGTNLVGGALVISCEGSATEDWIRTSFDGVTGIIGSSALKVLAMNEMPKPVKVAFKTRDTYTKDPKTLLLRLQRYNPELKTGDWRVLQHVAETQSSRWIFEVDLAAAEAIRKAGCCVHTGLDKGTIKILLDPNKKRDQEEGAKEGISSKVSFQQ